VPRHPSKSTGHGPADCEELGRVWVGELITIKGAGRRRSISFADVDGHQTPSKSRFQLLDKPDQYSGLGVVVVGSPERKRSRQ